VTPVGDSVAGATETPAFVPVAGIAVLQRRAPELAELIRQAELHLFPY
jgi:hypothetical protein